MATQTEPVVPGREAETQTDSPTPKYCNASTQTDWQEERYDEGRKNHGVSAQMALEMAACQIIGPQHVEFGYGLPNGSEITPKKMGELEDPSGGKPKKLSRGHCPADDPESASMSDGPIEDPEAQDDHYEEPTDLGDEPHNFQASNAGLDPPSKIRWVSIETLSVKVPWRGKHIPVVLPPPPGFFRKTPIRRPVERREKASTEPSSPEPHELAESEIWPIKKQKPTLTGRAKGHKNVKPEWAASSRMSWDVPIMSTPSVSGAAGKEEFKLPVFSQRASTSRLEDCFVFKGA